MKLCPNCGASLAEVIGGYMCHECGGGMFSEDEVICPQCPRCGDELGELGDEFYCFSCPQSVSRDSAVYSKGSSGDDFEFDDSDYDFEVGKDVKIKATIELKPEVELKEYKGLTVDVEEYVIPDDAFDKALENLLSQSSKMEIVTDSNSTCVLTLSRNQMTLLYLILTATQTVKK